jgi:hypothetical protein
MKRALGMACIYSALTFALLASGCQSVALRPRPDVERGPGVEPREPDVERRETEPGAVIERGAVKEEIVGTRWNGWTGRIAKFGCAPPRQK